MTSAKPLALTRQAVREGLEVLRWCRMPSFSSDVAFEPGEVLPESGEHPEEDCGIAACCTKEESDDGKWW